jgi:hypothetical protein
MLCNKFDYLMLLYTLAIILMLADSRNEKIATTNTATTNKGKSSKKYLEDVPTINLLDCKLKLKTQSFKISEHCEAIDFPLVECSGYCNSQSMIWADGEEVQTASCCSISNFTQANIKIYCVKRPKVDEINVELYDKMKDGEVKEEFRRSFSKSTWKRHELLKDNRLYKGYYTVSITNNATCSCEKIYK